MAVTYGQYIQTFLKVDEDSKGLYVEVPGYASDTFKVRCEENDVCPQVTHCRCSKFAHKGTCEHADAAKTFWARIYKTNIIKHQEKQLQAAMDQAEAREETEALVSICSAIETPKVARKPLVRKCGNKLVLVNKATKSPVAKIIEQAVQATLPTPKKDMMTAQFGNRGFSLMR